MDQFLRILLGPILLFWGGLILIKGQMRWERELEIEKLLPAELADQAKELSIRQEVLITSLIGGGLVLLGAISLVSCVL